MEKHRPLVHKSDEPHGYFWTIWGDWGLVPKVGLAFIIIVCVFTYAFQYPELDHQKKSFETALASISEVRLAKPLTQRQAKLLKLDNLYSWRAVAWIDKNGKAEPWIWQAEILKEGNKYRTVSVNLEPYEKAKAQSLGLLDQVD